MADGKLGYHSDKPPTLTDPSGNRSNASSAPVSVRITDILDSHPWTRSSSNSNGVSSKRSSRPKLRDRIIGPLNRPPEVDDIEADWWKTSGLWAIDTINANSFGSTAECRNKSKADAAILQETKAADDNAEANRGAADKDSWVITQTPAKCGANGGRSGGAAILASKKYALRELEALQLTSEPHRATFAETSVGGGITLVSLYLRHKEGLTPANRLILEETAGEVAQLSGSWVIGTDANMSPQTLRDSGWLEMIKGSIVAPSLPTCFASTYDYFVVSSDLSAAVAGVQVLSNAGTFPHKPVRLQLAAAKARRLGRRIRKPKLVPGLLPAGPPTKQYVDDHLSAPPPQQQQQQQQTTTTPAGTVTAAVTTFSPNAPNDDIEAMAQRWVAKSRQIFSDRLGKDLGDDDRASFSHDARRTDSAASVTSEAARWRSAGNMLHALAAHWRKLHSHGAGL